MKSKFKGFGRSFISAVVTICMLFSIFAPTIMAATSYNQPKTVKPSNGVAENEDIYYVSLGDSMSNGYGLDENYDHNGYYHYADVAYPNQFAKWLADYKKANVIHDQLAMSGMRVEDLLFALTVDYGEGFQASDLAPKNPLQNEFLDLIGANGEDKSDMRWNAVVEFNGKTQTVEKHFKELFLGADYYLFDNEVLSRFDHYGYDGAPDGSTAAAKKYQEAVAKADIITLAIGNGNFGVFMFHRALELSGFMSAGSDVNVAEEYNPQAVLDRCTDPQIKELLAMAEEEVNKILGDNSLFGELGLDAAGPEFLEKFTNLILYTAFSYVESYTLMIRRMIELNPDVEIIFVGNMNTHAGLGTTLNGEPMEMGMAEIVGYLTDFANYFVSTLSTYLQLEEPETYGKAKFYYAEVWDDTKGAGGVECVVDVYNDLIYDPKNTTVRDRFVTSIVGKYGDGMVWSMAKPLLAGLGYNLVTINYNDIITFENALKAAKAGNSDALIAYIGEALSNSAKMNKMVSCVIYLGFETAALKSSSIDSIDLSAVIMLLADPAGLSAVFSPIINSIVKPDASDYLLGEADPDYIAAMKDYNRGQGAIADVIDVVCDVIAAMSGGLLTSAAVKALYLGDKTPAFEIVAAKMADQTGYTITWQQIEALYLAETEAEKLAAAADVIAANSGGYFTKDQVVAICGGDYDRVFELVAAGASLDKNVVKGLYNNDADTIYALVAANSGDARVTAERVKILYEGNGDDTAIFTVVADLAGLSGAAEAKTYYDYGVPQIVEATNLVKLMAPSIIQGVNDVKNSVVSSIKSNVDNTAALAVGGVEFALSNLPAIVSGVDTAVNTATGQIPTLGMLVAMPDIIGGAANEDNLLFLSMLHLFARNIIGDGIGAHPSAKGHDTLAAAVIKAYKEGNKSAGKLEIIINQIFDSTVKPAFTEAVAETLTVEKKEELTASCDEAIEQLREFRKMVEELGVEEVSAVASITLPSEFERTKQLLLAEIDALIETIEEFKYLINNVEDLDKLIPAINNIEARIEQHKANILVICDELQIVAKIYLDKAFEIAKDVNEVAEKIVEKAYKKACEQGEKFEKAYDLFVKAMSDYAAEIDPSLGVATEKLLRKTPADILHIICMYGEDAIHVLVTDAAAMANELFPLIKTLVSVLTEYGVEIYNAVMNDADFIDLIERIETTNARIAAIRRMLVYNEETGKTEINIEDLTPADWELLMTLGSLEDDINFFSTQLTDVVNGILDNVSPAAKEAINTAIFEILEMAGIAAEYGKQYVGYFLPEMQAMAGELLASLLGNLGDYATAAAPSVVMIVGSVINSIKEFAEGKFVDVKDYAEKNIISKALYEIEEMYKLTDEIKAEVEILRSAINDKVTPVSAIKATGGFVAPDMSTEEIADEVVDAILEAIETIETYINYIESVYASLDFISAESVAIANAMIKEAQVALDEIIKVMEEYGLDAEFACVYNLLVSLENNIDSFETNVADAIYQAAEAARDAFTKFLNDLFIEFVVYAVDQVAKYGPDFVASIYNYMIENPEDVLEIISVYGPVIGELVSRYDDEIVEVLVYLFATFGPSVVEVIVVNRFAILGAMAELVREYGDEAFVLIRAVAKAAELDQKVINAANQAKDELLALIEELEKEIAALSDQLGVVIAEKQAELQNYVAAINEQIREKQEEFERLAKQAETAVGAAKAAITAQMNTLRAEIAQLNTLVANKTAEINAYIAKVSAVTNNKINALKADIENLMAELEVLNEKIVNVVEDTALLLDAFNSLAMAFASDVKDDIGVAINAIKVAVEKLNASINEAVDMVNTVIDAADRIDLHFNEILTYLADLDLDTVGNIAAAIANIADAVAEIDEIVNRVYGELVSVNNAAKELLGDTYYELVDCIVGAIEEIVPEIADFFYDYLMNNVDKVVDFITSHKELVREGGEAVVGVIAYVLYYFGEEIVDYVLDNNYDVLKKICKHVKEYSDKAWDLLEVYAEAIGLAAQIQIQLETVNNAVNSEITKLNNLLKEIEKEINDQIDAKLAQIAELNARLETATGAVKTQIEKQIATLQREIEALRTTLANQVEAVRNEIARLERALVELNAQLMAAVDAAEELSRSIAGMVVALNTQAEKQIATAIKAINSALDKINAAVNSAIDTASTKINAAVDSLVAAVEALQAKANELALDVNSKLQASIDRLVAAVEAIKAAVETAYDNAVKAIEYLEEALYKAYQQFADAVVAALKEYAPKVPGYVYDYLLNNPEEVIEFITEYSEYFEQLGDVFVAVSIFLIYYYGADVLAFMIENHEAIIDGMCYLVREYGDEAWALIVVYAEASGLAADIQNQINAAKDAVNAEITRLNNLIKDIEQDINDQIDAKLAQIAELNARLETATGAVKTQIEKQIATLEREIAELRASLEAQVQVIRDEIARLEQALVDLNEQLMAAVDAAEELARSIADLIVAINNKVEEQIAEAIALINCAINKIEAAINRTIEIAYEIKTCVENIIATTKALVETAKDYALETVAKLEAAINKINETVVQLIADAKAAYESFKVTLSNAYTEFVNAAVSAVDKYAPKIAPFIYSFLLNNPEKVIAFIVEYGEYIVMLGEAFVAVSAFLLYYYGEEVVRFVVANHMEIFEAMCYLVNEYGDEAWDLIVVYAEATGLTAQIQHQIDTVVNGVKDKLAVLESQILEYEREIQAMIAERQAEIEFLKNKLQELAEDDIVRIVIQKQIDKLNAEIAELEALLMNQVAIIKAQIGILNGELELVVAQVQIFINQVEEFEKELAAFVMAIKNQAYDQIVIAISTINNSITRLVALINEVSDKVEDEIVRTVAKIATATAEIEKQAKSLAIETLKFSNDRAKELAIAIDNNARDLKAMIDENVANVPAAIRYILSGINSTYDLVKGAVAQMYKDATTGTYEADEDNSYYVALGDSILALAPGYSYADLLAEYLNVESDNFSVEKNIMVDMLDVIERKAEYLERADLISIGYGNVAIIENAMLALTGAAGADWKELFNDDVAALADMIMAELKALLLEEVGADIFGELGLGADAADSIADYLLAVLETFVYAYVSHVVSFPEVIASIRELAPDALIVIIGAYNEFDGVVIDTGDVKIDLGKYFGYVTDILNLESLVCAMVDGNIVYVDASEVETCIIAETNEGVRTGAFDDYVSALVDPTQLLPSVAGHEYIFEQIKNAIEVVRVTVCHHEYDAICDDTCNLCGEKRIAAPHNYYNACDKDCNICGFVRSVPDHVYTSVCDATCNVCGEKRDAAAHTFGEWIVIRESTLNTMGERVRTCALCGAKESELLPLLIAESKEAENKGLSAGAIVAIVVPSTLALGFGVFSIVWFGIQHKDFNDLKKAVKAIAKSIKKLFVKA